MKYAVMVDMTVEGEEVYSGEPVVVEFGHLDTLKEAMERVEELSHIYNDKLVWCFILMVNTVDGLRDTNIRYYYRSGWQYRELMKAEK